MAELIESFETAKGNMFGDLLSKREQGGKLKIGLVTVAFFEYWRMFSPEMKGNVTGDMAHLHEQLRQRLPFCEIVWPGLIDTLDAAEQAGLELAERQVDLIIYAAGTYCPDYMAIQLLEHVRQAPVLMFNTQRDSRINLKTNYENIIRNSALIANMQLAASFRKMGWYKDLHVVVGSLDDEAAYDEIACYARALKAYKELKRVNLGVIGHVFRGMYDFEYDKTMVKGTLGPNLIAVQLSHLLEQYEQAG
ncbi:hypothetical protein, partial [Paenibacillus agaridevorans]|uniref:hypothetical protein n=1 Tax=Paenibacillus agaridevorans TaxID=171404 RepID=UPI0015E7F350